MKMVGKHEMKKNEEAIKKPICQGFEGKALNVTNDLIRFCTN